MIEGTGLNYLCKFEDHGTLTVVAMSVFGFEACQLANVLRTHVSVFRSRKDSRT